MRQSSPLKILITSNPLNHEGGVVNFVRLLVANQSSLAITVVHHATGSKMTDFYVPWRKRLLYPLRLLGDWVRLCIRVIRDRQIQVVQVNPSMIPVPLFRDGLTLVAARVLGCRTVAMFHGWNTDYFDRATGSCLWRWLFLRVYGQCDALIVLAATFRRALEEQGIPAHKIHLLTTMYDSTEIVEPSTHHGPARFLYLGRVSALKGIEDLIVAAAELSVRGAAFGLTIVGHAGEQGLIEVYRAKVRKLGIQSHVRFAGRLDGHEKFRAYADADVLVLPSYTEGCPTTVVEALGSGLSVIASNVGALPDLIDEGKNGWLISAGDAEQLCQRLNQACLAIDDLRLRRAAIRSAAESHLDSPAVCRRLADILQGMAI